MVCVWNVENAVSFFYLSQCVFMCAAGVTLTPSNVMRVMKEVEWWGIGGLGSYLYIPRSKEEEIRQNFLHEMDQIKQAISYWINTDPLASWRRLITGLDWMSEIKLADSIRSNAEPLTGINNNT